MKTLYIYLILAVCNLYAENAKPRVEVFGKDYTISITHDVATIRRLTDGKSRQIHNLMWGEAPEQKLQPKNILHGGQALFLMRDNAYFLVDLDQLFRNNNGDLDYAVSIIEGGTFYKDPYVINRSIFAWSLTGIYPDGVITGVASTKVDSAEFLIKISGENSSVIITDNENIKEMIMLRRSMINSKNETPYRYLVDQKLMKRTLELIHEKTSR